MTEPVQATGQVTSGPETTTTQAPVSQPGQSESQQTTTTGPVEAESFFDPKTLEGKPELQAAYKQMQSAFTKRMQESSKNKHKIEAYDRFEKDPVSTARALLQQYGYQVAGGEQQQKPFEPKTWDEVLAQAEERAEKRVMERLNPVLNQVRDIKKQSIDSQLTAIDPNWRVYEDKMSELFQSHPTLANDPETLYRMAVPPEVLEARATERALAKINGKTASIQSSGGSQTPKTPTNQPQGPMNFDQAYAFARQKLAEQGVKPG